MKKIITSFFCISSLAVLSQNLNVEEGGEYTSGRNDADHPCITQEQYKIIEKQNIENCKKLGLTYRTAKKNTSSTLFSWPLKTTNGLNDCSYYYIGNYLDQDTTSPGIKDWNCGSVTYDGHKGTDICTYPYPFYKMDNNQVEIIAAAPGTIINRVDGNFDKNCAMSNATANYITVQHADGSCAMYWHMKMNSLTPKAIGQTVTTGEYLGIVGSSGSSTAPHLHFEVLSGITINTLNDSYSGTCNSLNANSWWVSQKPYTEPAIIQASVHPAVAVFPACPGTETPNEDSCFTGGTAAKFYIFVRNATASTSASMRIVNPGGSTFTSWTKNFVSNYLSSYWISTQTLPTIAGTYTFETTYNGIICSKTFTVNCGAAGVEQTNNFQSMRIYPNPASNKIVVQSQKEIGAITICNALGETVYKSKITNQNSEIDISDFPLGIYILQAQGKNYKLIKE